jgi:hypothetical protein
MIGDGFRIEGGRLDHDQQRVVAADEVAQILTRLNGGIVATDEEQKQLTQLVKLASLSGKKRLMKLACLRQRQINFLAPSSASTFLSLPSSSVF